MLPTWNDLIKCGRSTLWLYLVLVLLQYEAGSPNWLRSDVRSWNVLSQPVCRVVAAHPWMNWHLLHFFCNKNEFSIISVLLFYINGDFSLTHVTVSVGSIFLLLNDPWSRHAMVFMWKYSLGLWPHGQEKLTFSRSKRPHVENVC